MFDIDEFLEECRAARAETEPRRAVGELLRRTVADGAAMSSVFAPRSGGITVLERSDELTVLHVVWAPGMRITPHDHGMWAAIGIYGGQEDNEFYRRVEPGAAALVPSGGKHLAEGEVVLLGDDVIHAVVNPLDRLTAAIHVYGGDLTTQPRSEWDSNLATEQPYDMAAARAHFERANGERDAVDRTTA